VIAVFCIAAACAVALATVALDADQVMAGVPAWAMSVIVADNMTAAHGNQRAPALRAGFID